MGFTIKSVLCFNPGWLDRIHIDFHSIVVSKEIQPSLSHVCLKIASSMASIKGISVDNTVFALASPYQSFID